MAGEPTRMLGQGPIVLFGPAASWCPKAQIETQASRPNKVIKLRAPLSQHSSGDLGPTQSNNVEWER